jgi:hypothetical protein
VDVSASPGCPARLFGIKTSRGEQAHFAVWLVNRWEGEHPLFADVWQIKGFKSFGFGSVASKGVMGGFFGCVARKGVRGKGELKRQGCIETTKRPSDAKAKG